MIRQLDVDILKVQGGINMQGIADQRVINSQNNNAVLISQMENTQNNQALGERVVDAKQGQDSSQTGTSQEGPAYIISISKHEIVHTEVNSEEIMNQYYKDNGIDPAHANDAMKEDIAGSIENCIKDMLDPLSKFRDPEYAQAFNASLVKHPEFSSLRDPKYLFREATEGLIGQLNMYECYAGTDDVYYKKLTDTLDAIDPDHKNSVVSYIKDLVGRSTSSEKDVFYNDEVDAFEKAFDDSFGHLSIDTVMEKGNEKRKAFDETFGESSEDKFWARGLKATPPATTVKGNLKNEIVSELIKALDASTEGDTSKTSTSDIGVLVNQRASQASNASNEQMTTLKRQLDKTSVGNVVDVEM